MKEWLLVSRKNPILIVNKQIKFIPLELSSYCYRYNAKYLQFDWLKQRAYF